MNLSLSMIANRLKHFSPTLCGNGQDTDIKYARFFSPAMSCAAQTMDIGTSDQFFGDGQKQIVCKYKNNYLTLDMDAKELAMNEILEVLRLYREWGEQLAQLIQSGCTMTELLDASERMIQNPLLILDASDYMVAVSTRYLTIPVDEHWFELLDRKASTSEQILAFHDPANAIFDAQARKPFYIPQGFFPRGSYSVNLYNGTVWCGILVAVEYLCVFNEGMIDDLSFLAEYIKQWIHQNTSADRFSFSQAMFVDIFSGASEKIPVLKRRLLSQGWTDSDQKLLIRARALSKNFHTDAYLCRTLNNESRCIFSSPCSEDIIILCNISSESEDTLLQQIKQWFFKSRYRGGISFPFTDFTHIMDSYSQASIALKHGALTAGSLNPARLAAVPYIIHTLNAHMTPDIRHPALRLLSDYDQKHHTDYLHTLKIFLENERSTLKTAAQLHIHRNTLTQRLIRLQEDFGLNLDDTNERFYLLISFYIRDAQP